VFGKLDGIERGHEAAPGMSDDKQFILLEDSADAFDICKLSRKSQQLIQLGHVLEEIPRFKPVNRFG